MKLKIKNALISVSDKENLISLLKSFKKHKIKIISSGGTYRSIKKLGYKCTELSKYTGFKEMLDGRVKLFIQKFMQVFCTIDKIEHIKMKCPKINFQLLI